MADNDWGCLWVWADDGSLAEVTRAVHDAYLGAGLRLGTVDDADPLLPPLFPNDQSKLGPDDVIVVEDECGWIAVMSLRHEWGRLGAHPLALVLSKKYEVLSIASHAREGFAEYAMYRGGKLAELLVRGEAPEHPSTAGLSLERLAERGGFAVEDLEGVLDEPLEFAKFAGCEWSGHRMVFEVMSLNDLGPEHLHIFR